MISGAQTAGVASNTTFTFNGPATLNAPLDLTNATGGSYTATADQLFLHRNTAQYRVQKAEELRGRPLREGRLDVELALLACHWLGSAVLQPGS